MWCVVYQWLMPPFGIQRITRSGPSIWKFMVGYSLLRYICCSATTKESMWRYSSSCYGSTVSTVTGLVASLQFPQRRRTSSLGKPVICRGNSKSTQHRTYSYCPLHSYYSLHVSVSPSFSRFLTLPPQNSSLFEPRTEGRCKRPWPCLQCSVNGVCCNRLSRNC